MIDIMIIWQSELGTTIVVLFQNFKSWLWIIKNKSMTWMKEADDHKWMNEANDHEKLN